MWGFVIVKVEASDVWWVAWSLCQQVSHWSSCLLRRLTWLYVYVHGCEIFVRNIYGRAPPHGRWSFSTTCDLICIRHSTASKGEPFAFCSCRRDVVNATLILHCCRTHPTDLERYWAWCELHKYKVWKQNVVVCMLTVCSNHVLPLGCLWRTQQTLWKRWFLCIYTSQSGWSLRNSR